MDLNAKLVAAGRCGGWLGDLTVEQAALLVTRGWARRVETTGRWILTDAGIDAARTVEAELTADELAQVEGVR